MKTSQRISVFLLCISMIFTMLPTGASAETNSSTEENIQSVSTAGTSPMTQYRRRSKIYEISREELSAPWIRYDMKSGTEHLNMRTTHADPQNSQEMSAMSSACVHKTEYVYKYYYKPYGVIQENTYYYGTAAEFKEDKDNDWIHWVTDGSLYYRYTYCTKINHYTEYYYYMWSEWTEWGDTAYTPDENTEVETREIYAITYDANGGINAPASQIKIAGKDCVLRSRIPTNGDLTFLGWATTPNGRVEYQPGDQYAQDVALTLYAIWDTTKSIAVKTLPRKTEYEIGDELDTTDLVLTVTHFDGSTEEISEGFTVGGFDSLHAGRQTIWVCYHSFFTSFTVIVNCSDKLIWSIDANGILTITDCDTSAAGELVIPAAIEGCPVTGLGECAFQNCRNLTSITIPESVTSIGSYAFCNCTSLTSVTVPDSVTSIGESAFAGCSGLESITIPFVGDSKKTASDTYQYPFGYIFGISRYTGGVATKQYYYGSSTDGITSSDYYIPSSLKSVTVTGGNLLLGAFYGCSGLTSVTVPDSVTTIGEYAFYGCSGLTSVTVPESVTSIGSYAFCNCTSLTSVTIPDSVTSIGESAFAGCSSLESITIPDSVTSIGESAFAGCSSLESITIPFVGDSKKTASDTYQYPFGYIFGTSSYTGGVATTQYYYGSSTSSDTGSTYYIPSSLKCVTVTEGNILYGALSYCTGLTSVTIGDSVTSIGEGAFYKCTSLTSVTIPDSVTSIGNYAFYNCTSLKHVAYSGTQAQWNKISIGSYNSPLIGAAIWHYEAVDQVYFKKNCVEVGIFCDLCRDFITKETVESGKHTYEGTADTYCDDCGYTRTSMGIGIGQYPIKQNYSLLRDELDATGGTILITYSDSSTEEIAITEDMVSGFDNRIYGQQTLTVTYSGYTATYTIQCVADYTPDKLEIETKPEQVSYLTNQELIWDGLSIKATYEEVEVELALAELMIDAVDMTTPGIKTVTVRYYDAAATFQIFVHEMVRTTADSSSYPESNHNYAANTNETKIFTYPGAEQLKLTFSSQSYTESNYDFVYILDGEGHQIGKYSGNLSGKVVAVPGDTVQIKLTSDHIVNKYGYAFASIEAEMILHPGEGFCEICGEFKATSGETASLTESMTLEAFTIPAGVTVDLSGHVLTVDSLASFGQIIDSVGGGGLIAGNVEITSNDWLPILDSTGCYRFYEYAVENLGTKSGDDSAIFGFALDFEDAMAYTTLLGSDDVQVGVTLAVGNTTKTYAFSQELIEKYVNLVTKYPALQPYLRLNVAGLDTVADGTVITVTPSITAVDGKISKTGAPMIYTA